MSRTTVGVSRRAIGRRWPHNEDMYSALAIQVMKANADQQRRAAREDHDPSSAFTQLRTHFDAAHERRWQDDKRRLEAERDPVQREALRRADAEQRAENARAEAQFRAKMRRIAQMTGIASQAVNKAERSVKRMLDRLSALRRVVDQAKEVRDARLQTYRLIVVSTLTLILGQQQALALWRVRLAADRHADPPPQLLDIGAVISAPRPGPYAGTALAA